MSLFRQVLVATLCLAVSAAVQTKARADLQFGFARRDATPERPLRLSGYGNRAVPFEGIDTPLQVRAMALRSGEGPVFVLLSVDTIGFPAQLTQEVLQQIESRSGVSRARLALCGTHSHTAPHLGRGLDNLFSTPLTDDERSAAVAYTDHLRDECVAAVGAAIADLRPGRLFQLQGTAKFARNRRVIKDGVWTGFGENPDGPVDHSLPVLAITGPDGQTLRGLVFNYACHCTTFGGDYNRVNGDWAGYAAEYLEGAHSGTVAMCTIGCGADQNPERDSRRARDIAVQQGHEIADEVNRLLSAGPRIEITAAPQATYGFAGLPIDRPSVDDLRKALEDKRPQVRHHAEVMLDIHARMGRLPETYPMPIQVWRFGDQLAMVFLGGEVCVEYAHRIRRELAPALKPQGEAVAGAISPVWVTAYANDVFGYVAPERMRSEGGYEVDYSMIYYLQPGRWSTGTEDVILRRVHELFEQQGGDEPLSVNDALRTFTLPAGTELQLVVAEPLVRDPINCAIDAAGRLWVVEMGDYPRGGPDAAGWSPAAVPGKEPWNAGPPAGRIRVVTDADGDGNYDTATTFLDGLSFPTGVYPWRDGVVVSCAPEIFFARDADGDGRCDHRQVLYSGFKEDNPQHRVNGFELGLDGWLYLASGASNARITCHLTGETVDISGRDLRMHLDSGRLEPVSGRSQYGRCRDAFGNWFANTNSEPLFQFVLEDRELRRNPFVASPAPRAFLTDPPRAPPVYPTSRTLDRFNDLYAANRFTSACSPCVIEGPFLMGSGLPATPADAPNASAGSVLICEPVHNLVSRVRVQRDGIVFSAARDPSEQERELLSSTDPWFRPARLVHGPEGGVWICDMYRQVIEHPQWIPEAWQARLNLSAGSDRGRIYRLVPSGSAAPPAVRPLGDAPQELVAALASPSRWRRDTAQRLLLERGPTNDPTVLEPLRRLVASHADAAVRTQALWTLVLLHPGSRQDGDLRREILASGDPDLVCQGLRLFDLATPPLERELMERLHNSAGARGDFALALAAGDVRDLELRRTLLAASVAHADSPWMRAAILSSATGVAAGLLTDLLRAPSPPAEREGLIDGLIATSLGDQPAAGLATITDAIAPTSGEPVADWQLAALATCLDHLPQRPGKSASGGELTGQDLARVQPILLAAAAIAIDANRDAAIRGTAIRLLGRQPSTLERDRKQLAQFLSPQEPPEAQSAAIERLAALGAASPLLEHLARLGPRQQAAVETALLERRGLTQALLAALESGQVPARHLAASTRAALVNHRDAELRAAAVKLLGASDAPLPQDVSERLARVTPLPAEPARGRVVFEKRCSTCHRHQGLGTDVGPQLAALTNKSLDFLVTAIVDVNRSVEPRYRSCAIELTDGRLQTGLIIEETAANVTLATADGRRHDVLRRDIAELHLTPLSFMPEGLARDLSDQDLADVIAFIREGTP